MHSPNDSRLRKGFRGVSQFPGTVARIMMGNRTLKIAYDSLLTTSTATIAFASFIFTVAVTFDNITVYSIVWPLLTIGLIHLIGPKYGVTGLITGASVAGLHIYTNAVHIAPGLVRTSAFISIVLTVIAMVFLMKHAIAVGSLVWDTEMTVEMESDTPPDDDEPDTETL